MMPSEAAAPTYRCGGVGLCAEYMRAALFALHAAPCARAAAFCAPR